MYNPLPVKQPYTPPPSAHQTRNCSTVADASRCLHSGTLVSQKWHVLATPHALKHDKYTHTQGYHYTDSLVIKLSSLISILLLQVQVRLLAQTALYFEFVFQKRCHFWIPMEGKKL